MSGPDLGPDLDPRHVLEQDQAAVRFGPQHDLFEVLGRGQQGLRGDRRVQHLPLGRGLAAEAAVPKTVMIDATYLKAHRTASSLRVKKGISAV